MLCLTIPIRGAPTMTAAKASGAKIAVSRPGINAWLRSAASVDFVCPINSTIRETRLLGAYIKNDDTNSHQNVPFNACVAAGHLKIPSAARVAAGDIGFLTLIQVRDGYEYLLQVTSGRPRRRMSDMCGAARDVCFTPNSDRKSGLPRQAMSALLLKVDVCDAGFRCDE